MLDYTACNLSEVAVHFIGNPTNNESLQLSRSVLDIENDQVKELLIKFFLSPFSAPEFYSFTFSNADFNLNPLCNFASKIFENSKALHKTSAHIAKHLHELSVHPQIKAGDLFVAYLSAINMDGQATDAIGIFKSENRQAFLKLDKSKNDFSIDCQDGINIEKVDKGCLIFNVEKDSGYKVCIVDRGSKSAEAQYWKDDFLNLKPCSDEFNNTKNFLNLTKTYITQQLPEEFEVVKTDQIDLLNRSVEYFKTHESFDKIEFEKEVFQDTGIIKSFRNFDTVFQEDNNFELSDTFDISAQAVKKQAKIFKSVLKLDKNFHIYIHGNKDLIEQGVEKDGRKFYKIYFKEEA